jgi:hypothetical protein
MSTKTTFKRVALVVVATLGFGTLSSVAPASAYAASMSTIPSLTVVGSNWGFIPVTLTADGTTGNAAQTTGESLTATVVAQPTTVDSSTAAADLEFTIAKRTAISTWVDAANIAYTATTGTDGSFWVAAGGDQASITNPARPTRLGTYWLAVKPSGASKAIDKGVYTIRLRLTDANGFITSTNVSVNFVTSAADSGAAIAVTATGSFRSGESVTMDANRSWTAALTNGTTGGRVQLGQGTLTSGPSLPVLKAQSWADATSAIKDDFAEFQVTDTGTQVTDTTVNGDFYSATADDSATAWSSYANGVYGITGNVGSSFAITSTSVSPKLRVYYGATAVLTSLTGLNAAAGTAVFAQAVATGALTAVSPFTLPLTTKTVTLKWTGATAGLAYQYTVAWTKVAAGDQTPVDATPTLVYADSTGAVTVSVTNANPIDGASASVTVSGFATNPAAATVINWVKSKAVNVSVDVNGAVVPLKNATVFTVTITDNFGAPVAGVLLQPSLSSGSANYSATPMATVLTDASGKATVTITDALAVAAGTDVLTFTAVDGSTLTGSSNPATITYAAAAPAPTALIAYYTPTPATVATTSIVSPVPTTGVYVDAVSAKFPIQKARNTSIGNAKADSVDQLGVRINAGVAGVRVVATASAGAYILSSSNLQGTSRTLYSGTTGFTPDFILGSNKTGANTVTFTAGTVTTTVSFWVGNTGNDARFVTLAQAGAGSPVVAQVTDRYGNGVSGASVQISTSAGTLGNGQMTTVYTTDLDGKISVLPTGADTAVITAIATNTSAEHKQAAGFANGVAVNATLAAGNDTATLTVAPIASATDVAQAATDAAAEATDAANAATDAANAAAEAADAATAAAQDAADAVAALSTQVSEMVDALKKQITALTNLVIKIQKKVKA